MTSSRFRFAFFASTLSNLEIGVMMRLRHPRIVTFLGAGEIVDPPLEGDNVPRVGIFVMLEYAEGGDLIHRLKAAAGSELLESESMKTAMNSAISRQRWTWIA